MRGLPVHCLENISFRREEGYCRICWYAASISDVDLGGKVTKGVIKVSDDIRGEINFRNLGIYIILGILFDKISTFLEDSVAFVYGCRSL